MGEQSGARLKGDDYQHLYSWFELLNLLNPTTPYEFGYVEHPSAGAADDVTLHSKHPGMATKFTQLKFHVDHKSQYSCSSLIEIPKPGSASLLQKLFDSWRKLRNRGNQRVEIWLVSNWTYAEDIGCFISDAGHFSEIFYKGGPKSNAGKLRAQWIAALGATNVEFEQFCRDLRLRLGFGGLTEVEERVEERMTRYGLRIGAVARANVLDIVRGWIKKGGDFKRIDSSVLERVIKERDLKAADVEQPKVSLIIHGWAKRGYDLAPTIELDWTQFFDFDTRTIASPEVWSQRLIPDLNHAKKQLGATPNGTYIDFRAKLPLTASLVVGRVFSEALGFRFRVEQPSSGETFLWRSDAARSGYQVNVTEVELAASGDAGIVSLSITGDSKPEVQHMISSSSVSFRSWMDISPEAGASGRSIKSAGDAVSIAEQLKELTKKFRQKNGLKTVHMVLYCPATVALFAGQRLNALGDVITYERTLAGAYQQSAILQTG